MEVTAVENGYLPDFLRLVEQHRNEGWHTIGYGVDNSRGHVMIFERARGRQPTAERSAAAAAAASSAPSDPQDPRGGRTTRRKRGI